MLRNVLRQINTADDLPLLFKELGYDPEHIPISDSSVQVARWKSFRVIATSDDDPDDGVRRLATILARDARRALAAVVSPDRILSLAAPLLGRQGTTRVLRVALDAPSAFALQQLERLRPQYSSNALAHALTVAEVLGSEQVGERFFTAFRRTLERMAASLRNDRCQDDRRLGALLSLTRILFLYFVQEKGWLDGNRRYLRNRLDAALAARLDFHRTVLDPLFFGTLNRPRDARSVYPDLGKVPYLNGGLFQPHPVERQAGPCRFSNEQWRGAFDDLFERFRFCVREAEDVDAIAPDMLGRVFERLMDGDERSGSGAFYTPESVVRQLVAATLETALTSQVSERVTRLLMARAPLPPPDAGLALAALKRLRILDPAVGSGAFLLGALEMLTDLRCALEASRDPPRRWEIRREILGENLMGVDINPLAVRLAELRLWLAVVADDPTQDIWCVTPLPNLDGVVRQGDTLLDPLGAVRRFGNGTGSLWNEVSRRVREARCMVFDSRGGQKAETLRSLRTAERELAQMLLERAGRRVRLMLSELQASAEARDLFGNRAGLPLKQRELKRNLEIAERDLSAASKDLEQEKIPFFSFEVHSPEVIADGGFSAVVGNPPWVRAERLTPSLRRTLRERFTWWRSEGAFGFSHQPDLSVAFLQRSLELVAPGGAVGFLLPSKVATSGYGEVARRGLVHDTQITYLHRVPDTEAADFGATTYPIGIVVKKDTPGPNQSTHLGFGTGQSLKQKALSRPGPWVLFPDAVQDALEELLASGIPLRDIAPPALGVKTGANSIFVGRVVEVRRDHALVRFATGSAAIEPWVLRPALRGRDIRPFRIHPRHAIVWTHTECGEPRAALPKKAASHLRRHEPQLRRRADYRTGPIWSLFRVPGAMAQNRVAWADIARRPRAVALDATGTNPVVPLNSCYVSAAPDRDTALVIAATMNSVWARALLYATADEARGGYRRMNARASGNLPVPRQGLSWTRLRNLSLEAHENDIDQHELDTAVADALSLSAATRRLLLRLAANNG